MTPLREKMDDDLRLRNLSVNTRKTYIHQVSRFARFFGKSPTELGTAEVRTYLLDLEASGRAPATRALAYGALQFLYVHTLQQPEVMASVPRPRHGPCGEVNPLLRSEVKAMLQAAETDVLDTTLLSTLLGTGLRNAELRNLRVGDIDRSAGLLYVRRGKGGKARCVQLGDPLYLLLRRYWSELRPPGPLGVPGHDLRYLESARPPDRLGRSPDQSRQPPAPSRANRPPGRAQAQGHPARSAANLRHLAAGGGRRPPRRPGPARPCQPQHHDEVHAGPT
jgi:integrase/recombinase XerD